MAYLLVGLGGILGSITRYSLGKIVSSRYKTKFPLATFMINVTGALFLGILTGIQPNKNIYLFLGDGFLGAYTTFSTFMYEGFSIFKRKEKLNAASYIIISLVLGIAFYYIGFQVGRK